MESETLEQLKEKPFASAETIYTIERWDEIQNDHFNKDGKKWQNTPIGNYGAETMLNLINQLKKELKQYVQL